MVKSEIWWKNCKTSLSIINIILNYIVALCKAYSSIMFYALMQQFQHKCVQREGKETFCAILINLPYK